MKPALLRAAILALFCAVLLLSGALYLLNESETPVVTLPSAPTGSSDTPGSSELGGGNYLPVDITPETVQAVVGETLARAENYSRSVTVESFWDGGSSATKLECYVRGDDWHVISAGDGSVKHILMLSGKLYIWYGSGGEVFSGGETLQPENAGDLFSRTLTYEELLSLDKSQITAAGYTDHNGVGCIYAEYSSGLLGYTTRVYIGIDTGLLIAAERYDGENLIYSMTSDTPVLDTPDDSHFTVPA